MPGPWYYADEKLSRVVYTLAIGRGDVRSRLLEAWSQIWVLSPAVVPPELHEDLACVKRQMTRFEPTSTRRASVEETMMRIRNATGEKIAQRLFDMYSRLKEASSP